MTKLNLLRSRNGKPKGLMGRVWIEKEDKK
jgi:hypothetical protein